MNPLHLVPEVNTALELVAFVAALAACVLIGSFTASSRHLLLTSQQLLSLEIERLRALHMFFALYAICVVAAIILGWFVR